MPIERSDFTHDVYIFKREGVRRGRPLGYWQTEGVARLKSDGEFFIYLHSTPIGGFDGRLVCRKFGSEPPPDETGTGSDDEAETGETQH